MLLKYFFFTFLIIRLIVADTHYNAKSEAQKTKKCFVNSLHKIARKEQLLGHVSKEHTVEPMNKGHSFFSIVHCQRPIYAEQAKLLEHILVFDNVLLRKFKIDCYYRSIQMIYGDLYSKVLL